MRNSR